MSNIEPTPFGDKYVLVEHIATGGMAEIYRAQYSGIEGFAKELVIKTLRDDFVERAGVVQMFLDEARVAATLQHNNVVHTYDLGELGGEYYIAMELLRGEELVNVLRRAAPGGGVPRDIAIAIACQALEGLNYVHSRTDSDGASLGLVHRDVNPTNIHVAYDGVCKILDFGIAATKAQAVGPGGGRAGKLAYMSPEQLEGHPLDHRADIFAMGVVLYELLLTKRLFRGPAAEVERRIREGDVPPPTSVDAEFPPELEVIILRALETDPNRRYPSCDHMFRELDAFAKQHALQAGRREIEAFMSSLFGAGDSQAEELEDDPYDDLHGSSLDFDAFERMEAQSDEAPDWVRQMEASIPKAQRGRSVTIGNLAALVKESGSQAAADPARGGRKDAVRSSGSHRVVPLGVSAPHEPIESGASRRRERARSQTFGSNVVAQEGRSSATWLLWVLALLVGGGFLFAMMSAK